MKSRTNTQSLLQLPIKLLHYFRVAYFRLIKPRLWRWFVWHHVRVSLIHINTVKPLFFNEQDHDSLSADLLNAIPRETILAQAEEARQHRFALFANTLREHGTTINWHKDYASEYTWELKPAWELDFMHSHHVEQTGINSDVKYVWELSRHHWFTWLGMAYLVEKKGNYVHAFKHDVRSWLNANPLGVGINWAMPMDVAIRATNWIVAHSFFHAAPDYSSDGTFGQEFMQSLWQHGYFLEYNLEYVRHNANHFTSNAMGLVVIGAFFYDCSHLSLYRQHRGKRWFMAGKRFLEREMILQVYDDGVNYEKSTSYHRFVAEMFTVAAVAAQRIQQPFSAQYYQRLVKMNAFIEAYTRADGTAPQWGDNDNGRVLRLLASEDFSKHLQNKLLNDIILRQSHQQQSDAYLQSISAPTEISHFQNGGFFIHRTAQTHIFMDVGDYGMNAWGGHGHNDCLALEFWLQGAPLLIDCGTGSYTANPTLRNELRSTRAHNTVMVEQAEQTEYGSGLWRIKRDELLPTVLDYTTNEHDFMLLAEHSAYASRFGIRHNRRIEHKQHTTPQSTLQSGELVITDTLENIALSQALSIVSGVAHYHIAPQWDITQESPTALRLQYEHRVVTMQSRSALTLEKCRMSLFYSDVREAWRVAVPCSTEQTAEMRIRW
jgi:hypothetical protein